MNQKLHTIFGYCWYTIMLVMVLVWLPSGLWAQSRSLSKVIEKDSVLMRTTIYFSPNGGDWIEKSEYKKVGKFLQWALVDTLSQIQLTGWTDKSGTESYNSDLSLRRARSIRNYLVKKGVSTERIHYEGCAIDTQAQSDAQARRVDMIGLAFIPTPIVAVQTVEPLIKEEKRITVAEAEEEKVVVTAEPVTSNNSTQSEIIPENNKQAFVPSRWYIGIGGGLSFGRSTFCSFAMDGTRPGFNVGVLGGYKINKLLSAELSLDYTRIDLRTYDCCQNLWMASDGNRYFAPLAGTKNYQYNNLRSTTNLVGLGAHLNIDLVGIWKDDSRWSALVMPAIYGVVSSADVKQISNKEKVRSESALHFGVGADLGVGYMITPCWGLRLKTGINLLTGKPMDAMPKAEHKSNYVWNTSLQVIFKL